MTAKTNRMREAYELGDLTHEENPVDVLISGILARINQSKINGLIDKCLAWIKQARNSSVRLCGVSFLRAIMLQRGDKMGKNQV